MEKMPEEFQEKLASVTNKRARCVIDTILANGYCSTENLKDVGYEHAPRAARDVRELGIPLETFKVKNREGKSIGAYRFGDWEGYKKQNPLSKTGGRTQLSNKLKQALIERYGSICFLYSEEYSEQQLQVDHRVPYEILGEQDENDLDNFMMLSPSANRAKSWACEHCSNWELKEIKMCEGCYYAYPEEYLHIAGEQERKIDMVFKDEDIKTYEFLKAESERRNVSIQEVLRDIIQEL